LVPTALLAAAFPQIPSPRISSQNLAGPASSFLPRPHFQIGCVLYHSYLAAEFPVPDGAFFLRPLRTVDELRSYPLYNHSNSDRRAVPDKRLLLLDRGGKKSAL